MHPNAALLRRLFRALDHHDHPTMAFCYHSAATFGTSHSIYAGASRFTVSGT